MMIERGPVRTVDWSLCITKTAVIRLSMAAFTTIIYYLRLPFRRNEHNEISYNLPNALSILRLQLSVRISARTIISTT